MSPAFAARLAPRAAALGLLGGIYIAIYLLVITPVWQMVEDRRTHLAVLQTQHDTYRSLVDQEAHWQRLSETSNDANALAAMLAEGEAVSVQAASLSQASDLAAASGVTILSTEARAAEAGRGVLRLPLVVRAEGDDAAMAGFLLRLARHRPLILVEQLSLRASPNQAASGARLLQGQFTLVVLARGGV